MTSPLLPPDGVLELLTCCVDCLGVAGAVSRELECDFKAVTVESRVPECVLDADTVESRIPE